MDGLIGLGGVVIGWLLSQGGQVFGRRREGRDAARLVAAEVVSNLEKLRAGLATGFQSPTGALRWKTLARVPPETEAWRTNKAALNLLAPAGLLFQLTRAYAAVEIVLAAIELGAETEQVDSSLRARGFTEEEMEELRVTDGTERQVVLSVALEELRNALTDVGALGDLHGLQLVFLRYGRWRQNRLYRRSFPDGFGFPPLPEKPEGVRTASGPDGG